MAAPIFNAKITLNSTNDLGGGAYSFQFNIIDTLGIFSGLDIVVGDLIHLDTSGSVPGTLTRYKITSITTQSATDADVNVLFDDDNPLAGVDPSSAIFLDGLISRPTPGKKIAIVSDPGTQILPTTFAIYPTNANMGGIIDDISATPGGATQDIQFNNAGALAGSSNFKIDTVDGSLNLNGLRHTILASFSVAANIASPTPMLSFSATSYPFAILEFSTLINGNYSISRMLITNDGTNVSINGDYVETNPTGLTVSADISGGNVRVLYTNSVNFTGTVKYSLRRWS